VLRETLWPPHSRQFATQFVVRLFEVVEHFADVDRFDFEAIVRERWNKRTSTTNCCRRQPTSQQLLKLSLTMSRL